MYPGALHLVFFIYRAFTIHSFELSSEPAAVNKPAILIK